MQIHHSTNAGKRYVAIFSDGQRVHFGSSNGRTYIDHHDVTKRANYIARHRVRESFNNPRSAGSLARWLLWGPFKTLDGNRKFFMKRFTNL